MSLSPEGKSVNYGRLRRNGCKITDSLSFLVNHPDINLELRLMDLKNIHAGENVIDEYLCKIVESIRSDGILMHPIIVDKRSGVLLDGSHRMAAAKELGFRYLPVCLFDWTKSNIKIGCWYRTINPKSKINRILKIIEDVGFEIQENCVDEAHEKVRKREATASVMFHDECYTIHGIKEEMKDVYDDIRKIEMKLRIEGYTIGFETEDDARLKLDNGETFSIIVTPKIMFREFLDTALKKEVFHHKSTRMVIPVRPLFVNVPNELLCSKFEPEKVNEKFIEHLSAKKVRRIPQGQILDRRYEEKLIIFE
jgi:hypothetical protein